jgi:hypothetical protein
MGPTLELDSLFHASALAIAGGALFWRGFGWLRTLRRIENTPTAKVRSLSLGAVELCGAAEAEEPLVAPLSGKPAVWYEIVVEELRSSRRGSRWVVRKREQSSEPFHLRDETGRIQVLPDGADTHLPDSFTARVPGVGVSANVESYLDRSGLRRGLFGRSYRLRERSIGPGDPVYVLGVAQERPDLRREKTKRLNERLHELRSDPERLQALDVDGDGQISDLEWDRARSQARSQVEREAVEDRVVIGRGEGGETFVLSNRDELELVQSLRWKAFGGVFGGGGLVVGGIAYLVYSLGGVIS